jgi:hypothetical protein
MFKFRGRLDLCTSRFLIPLYCISCHIWVNVSFKFGGMDKHYVYLFICLLFCLFLSVYICFFLYIKFFIFVCCYVVDWAQLIS